MSDDDDSEHLHLVSNRKPLPETRADETIALGNAYATVKGQRQAESLMFRRKDGTSFVMPYNLLPILWGHPPGAMLIEYPGFFTVALSGKNLDTLYERIGDRRVTWVRECDEPLAASLPEAVTRIEILRSYPSREVGQEPETEVDTGEEAEPAEA